PASEPRSAGLELAYENAPETNEQRGDEWPDYEAAEAEHADAADRRNQYQVIRHPGLAPDQYRAQHIVDQADNPGAEGREHNRLPDGSRDQEVNGDRCPDQGGAHRRYQRGENHHGPPQYRSLHAEHPEDKAAEHALHDGDDQIAAHGGPNDVDDALHQQPLLVFAERQSADDQFDDGAAVAQKKEGHIQHHPEADQELAGSLADAQHLRAHIAANLDRRILESLAQLADIYTEPIQYVLHGGWQFSAAFDVTQKIAVAGLNCLVKLGAFMRRRQGNTQQWQGYDG